MKQEKTPDETAEYKGIYKEMSHCMTSSISCFYYSMLLKPDELPIARNQIRKMRPLGYEADVVLAVMENTEVTYTIELDHTNRWITCAFRGSMTKQDWLHDVHFKMAFLDNPVNQKIIPQSKTVGIHGGFIKYLFGGLQEEKEPVVHSLCTLRFAPDLAQETNKSCKYGRIFRHLSRLTDRHPEYKIHVTGHSLGGALATLASFCLASDGLNVTCVSLASPRVGNGDFVRAFQELEVRGTLRSLRVVNSDDIVTALPDVSVVVGLLGHLKRRNFYIHAGICLHFDDKKDGEDQKFGLYRPEIRTQKHALDDFQNRSKTLGKRALTLHRIATQTKKIPEKHDPSEYESRILLTKESLSSIAWTDLYAPYLPPDLEHL